jgi:hypothetical protein
MTLANRVSHINRLVSFSLAVTVAMLIIGFALGASKLAQQHGFTIDTVLAGYIHVHPVIMVFGVVGGLLISEKLEMMGKFKILGEIPISYPIVASMISGVTILSVTYYTIFQDLRFVGAALIATAGLLFMWFMISRRNPGSTDIKFIMGVSLLALALGAISVSFKPATSSPSVALLMLSFPILYIFGERIELGLMRGIKHGYMLLMKISAVLIPSLLFISSILQDEIEIRLLFDLALLPIFLFIFSVTIFDPVFRIRHPRGKLQRFMGAGILSSYIWIWIGLILYIIQVNISHGYMDAATHAIALGFIGSFIIAHSPVIFPLILKLRADTNRVTFSPIIALDLAVVLRVGGDLSAMVWKFGNFLSYLSIYILILAILLFLLNIMRIKNEPEGASLVRPL